MKPEEDEMAMKTCETLGCEKEARLQCPTCIKLQIKVMPWAESHIRIVSINTVCICEYFQGSFFCSQECFHGSWNLHKALHKLAKSGNPSSCSKPNRSYNPWPGYVFTGKLRPAEQSNKRVVPDHIPRPDYADHPEGYPLSEQKLRGNTYVKQLDDEEIENLRVACKLGKWIKDKLWIIRVERSERIMWSERTLSPWYTLSVVSFFVT